MNELMNVFVLNACVSLTDVKLRDLLAYQNSKYWRAV